MTFRRLIGAVAVTAILALGGCSTVSKVGSLNPFHGKDHDTRSADAKAKSRANRIPVIALNDQLKVADALKGQDFLIPAPAPQADWPTPGGTLEQAVENVDAAPAFQIAWRKSIGVGDSRRHHIIAPPISADGKIFVMDGGAMVSAHDAKTGDTLWRANIMPKSKRDHDAWGGGLAYADGKIYASSGFREVVQIDAKTGAIGWRVLSERRCTPRRRWPTGGCSWSTSTTNCWPMTPPAVCNCGPTRLCPSRRASWRRRVRPWPTTPW